MSLNFKFSDYDVICFDMDNTLLLYNLSEIFELQYQYLSNYMTNNKGYDKDCFTPTLSPKDADFFQRALFLDYSRGNVLYVNCFGRIIKATHGTQILSDADIKKIYGSEKKWDVISQGINDIMTLWNNPHCRTFMDFTDSIVPLIFAKAVGSVDKKCDPPGSYNVWPDVLEAVVAMYTFENSYIQTLLNNMYKYFEKCNSDVMKWLNRLKADGKILLLITGNEEAFVKISLEVCFGKDYEQIFDAIIIEAKKPHFFLDRRPFLSLNGDIVENIDFKNIYKGGNWKTIYDMLCKKFKKEMKCVYVGDNPIQDIYAPNNCGYNLDVVAVIEELDSDGNSPGYPHKKYVSSEFWGPFIEFGGEFTFVGQVIKQNAKLIVPSLKVIASKPVDYNHDSFGSLW